jgi:protein translocase SecG subunit
MIEGILWVLFILGCFLVSIVILLQDSKGGGLGEAFGGVGQQAFGVDNKAIGKFTAYLACGLVVVAILITRMRGGGSVLEGQFAPEQTGIELPVDAGAGGVGDGAGGVGDGADGETGGGGPPLEDK